MGMKISPEVRKALDLHQGYLTGFNGRRPIQPLSEEELAKRLALIPEDTRDLTGRMFGDPIPGDRRRKCIRDKSSENANSVKELA